LLFFTERRAQNQFATSPQQIEARTTHLLAAQKWRMPAMPPLGEPVDPAAIRAKGRARGSSIAIASFRFTGSISGID